MKILFTTNIPAPYRIEFFNELSKYCDLTVSVERFSATDRKKEWTALNNINFNLIKLRGIKVGNDSAFCPEIIKYINKNKFDIIIVGGYSTPTGMLLIKYLKKKKIPFILNCDGGIIKRTEKNIVSKIKKYFISSANWWLSTGKITDEYLEYYGAKKEKIYRYNFTSIKNEQIMKKISEEEKNILKKQLGIKSKYIVITVGSFIHRKGFDILIKSKKYINNDIEFIIIGDKPTTEYLELINKNSITNISFIDFMAKEMLEKYYKISDVFILPTREDVWGLVINEAMAKSLPIITTNKCVAGIELIENNENGYIVPVEDCKSIAEKINLIIHDTDLKEKMERNNMEKAKMYTIENMAKQHLKIFNEIIKEKKL